MPQLHRPPSPYSQSVSGDESNDYYDYYGHPPAPSANYGYEYISDYSPLPSEHYVGGQSEGGEEVVYTGEEGIEQSFDGASTSWQAFTPIDSPVLAAPEPAPDYARMSMVSETPPPSNASAHTYLNRLANFVKKVHKMPWKAERVTGDYYPEKKIQRRKAKTHFQEDWYDRDAKEITAVSWRSRRFIEQQQATHGRHNLGMIPGEGVRNEDVASPYLGSLEPSMKSHSSSTGFIEPFPFTSVPHEEDPRRITVVTI